MLSGGALQRQRAQRYELWMSVHCWFYSINKHVGTQFFVQLIDSYHFKGEPPGTIRGLEVDRLIYFSSQPSEVSALFIPQFPVQESRRRA